MHSVNTLKNKNSEQIELQPLLLNNANKIAFLFFTLILLAIISLFIGSKNIPADVISNALIFGHNHVDNIIILESRVPRTLAGVFAGMALGAAGVLTQSLTRNNLAEPGIFGINAGASFTILLGFLVFGSLSLSMKFGLGILGAFATTSFVYFIGCYGSKRITGLRYILAGIAVASLFTGLSSGLALLNPTSFDYMRFWYAGTIDIRSSETILFAIPLFVLGAIVTLLLARSLNALALGDELATSLGNNTKMTTGYTILAITVLAGTATALTGPIAFVGLMIPFVARKFVGQDHRWLLPAAMLMAPILLLFADMLGRVLVQGEMRTSIITALLGGPLLIVLARRTKQS